LKHSCECCQREYSSRCNISHKVNCFARNSSSTRDVTPHKHTLCDSVTASLQAGCCLLVQGTRAKLLRTIHTGKKYMKLLHLCLFLFVFFIIYLHIDTEQVVSKAAPYLKRLVSGFPPRRPGFKPGFGHVGFCDGQKWRWGRFSPRTSVSPANLHSFCFSTIIFTTTRGWHKMPALSAVPIASQPK
jgi:hypothetical protein